MIRMVNYKVVRNYEKVEQLAKPANTERKEYADDPDKIRGNLNIRQLKKYIN